jgi:DNA-binding IclR family transcriptional regulator
VSQSIERAIEVLLMVGHEPLTPAQVSRRLDVHRSTALRIIEVLTGQRLLRKLPDGSYGIGPALLSLAYHAQDQYSLVRLARPRLVQLSEMYDQTVHLAELQTDQIVYIDKIEPKRSIRLTSRVGDAVCLHTASVAKSILAFAPEETRRHLLDGHKFEAFTSTSILSAEAYMAELEQVRQRGWSTDDGELEDYINCIGMPIRDVSGQVVAAVSVIELKAKSNLEEMQRTVLAPLREAAIAISMDLGWAPDQPSVKA